MLRLCAPPCTRPACMRRAACDLPSCAPLSYTPWCAPPLLQVAPTHRALPSMLHPAAASAPPQVLQGFLCSCCSTAHAHVVRSGPTQHATYNPRALRHHASVATPPPAPAALDEPAGYSEASQASHAVPSVLSTAPRPQPPQPHAPHLHVPSLHELRDRARALEAQDAVEAHFEPRPHAFTRGTTMVRGVTTGSRQLWCMVVCAACPLTRRRTLLQAAQAEGGAAQAVVALLHADCFSPVMGSAEAWGALAGCACAAALEVLQRLDVQALGCVALPRGRWRRRGRAKAPAALAQAGALPAACCIPLGVGARRQAVACAPCHVNTRVRRGFGPCLLGALHPRCLVVSTPNWTYNAVMRRAMGLQVGPVCARRGCPGLLGA